MKTIIYKIKDTDDNKDMFKYYTLNGLRIYILSELWDYWDNFDKECNEYSKNEIAESDEYLFAYLDSWNYQVDRILITDQRNMYF